MDIATLIGLLLGSALVLMAILIGGDLVAYLNAPSVLIVIGGATCATMASYPLARFLKLPLIMKKTVLAKPVNTLALLRQQHPNWDEARIEREA